MSETMTAVERIQAAIDKLTEWRGANVPPAVSRAVMKSAKHGQAQSMLGLVRLSADRMIDAQLAILRGAIQDYTPTDRTLALADAILSIEKSEADRG